MVVAARVGPCPDRLHGGGSHSASSGTTTTTSPAGAASIGSTTTSTSVVVPDYDPAKNARGDVMPGACVDGGANGWSFAGTVTNSSAD